MDFGPLDRGTADAPRETRLGLVGTAADVEALERWLDRCSAGIEAKFSRLPNLFPCFPGFGQDLPFASSFVTGNRLTRTLSSREVSRLTAVPPGPKLVYQTVDLFVEEARHLVDTAKPEQGGGRLQRGSASGEG